jgi:hypothetical protein
MAGFASSLIDDFDLVSNIESIAEMLHKLLTTVPEGVLKSYLTYPKDLYDLYTDLKNANDISDALTPSLMLKAMPPPKPTKAQVQFVGNAVSFMWKNYVTDANYWTSGELTAMVGPIILTGGAYAAKKVPDVIAKLAGRLSKNVIGAANRLDIVDLFQKGKKIDYDDIGDIEQVIVKNNDEIDGIYEKVGDELVPICGFSATAGSARGRVATSINRRCISGKGMTNAHYDKVEEIMGDRADALFAELEDNPNLFAGTIDDIEALAKIKKWRLKPNDAYINNGYAYKTDKYGRIESVEGNLKIDGVERHPDGPNVGEGDGKLPNDVGGHLIGRQYGGAGDATNVVAMEKTVNEYSNVGKFGQHEIRWRRLLNETPPANIQLNIKVIYEPDNFTIRPDAFDITETINGITSNFTVQNF